MDVSFFFLLYQEYVPEHDEITSKLVWEGVDRLNYVPESGVATWYLFESESYQAFLSYANLVYTVIRFTKPYKHASFGGVFFFFFFWAYIQVWRESENTVTLLWNSKNQINQGLFSFLSHIVACISSTIFSLHHIFFLSFLVCIYLVTLIFLGTQMVQREYTFS